MSSPVLWTGLIIALCVATGCYSEDEPQQASHMKVVIVSKQDENGEWINEVKLEHSSGQAPWKVEVEQKTVARGGRGREAVELTAVLTGPPHPVPKQQPYLTYHHDPASREEFEYDGTEATEEEVYEPESGYRRFAGYSSSYKVYAGPEEPRMDWMQAKKTCAEEGAHLAIINSEGEARLLSMVLQGMSVTRTAFVGITDEADEGTWLTVLGEPIADAGFDRWFRFDQPDNDGGNENCAVLFPAVYPTLNDVPCSGYHTHFICEKESTREIATPSLSTSPEPDWGLVENVEFSVDTRSYVFHLRNDKNWDEAKLECEKKSGYLAIINSEEESLALMQTLKRYYLWRDQSAFIGITDWETEGEFKTIFGEPLAATGFTRWFRDDQPKNDKSFTSEGENCGAIHSSNGGLNDVPCNQKHPFFCEIAPYLSGNQEQNDVHLEVTASHEGVAEIPMADSIPLGYERHLLYMLYPVNKNWVQAHITCRALGGHLAKINSVEQLDSLKNVLTRLPVPLDIELGISKALVDPEFADFVDFTLPHDEYADIDGEKNQLQRSNCAAILADGSPIRVSCDLRIPYICEMYQESKAGVQEVEAHKKDVDNSVDSSSDYSSASSASVDAPVEVGKWITRLQNDYEGSPSPVTPRQHETLDTDYEVEKDVNSRGLQEPQRNFEIEGSLLTQDYYDFFNSDENIGDSDVVMTDTNNKSNSDSGEYH